MDTKALRQKILDLAIRGKLVPQNPDDEPASVLLERIREQKLRLVEEGKLKKKDIKNDTIIFVGKDNLHYEKFQDGTVKCIEDEIPFEVPEGWEWARIGSICIINPRNNISDNLEVSFVPMSLISEGYTNMYTYEIRTWSKVKSGFTHFAENDIGIAKITPCFENRKSVIFKDLVNGYGAGTTELHILRTLDDTISNEYLLWIAKMDSFIQGGVHTFSGAVGQQRVGKDYISQYLIPVPPRNEQTRIINQINSIFEFIIRIENAKEDLEEIIRQAKSKILDLAIRGQLVPQNPDDEPASVLLERIRIEKEELIKQGKIKRDKKESIIFKGADNSYYEKIGDKVSEYTAEDIPLGWSIASFSQVNMFSTETINPSHFSDEMFELYSVPNFELGVPEIIRGQEIGSSKQSICENDLLVCKINPRINRVWITGHITPYRILGSSEWIVFRNNFLFTPYLQFYFSSPYFRELLLSNVSGVGGSLMRAQPESVKKYPILIPPYKEQIRIAGKISELFIKLDTIEKSLS